MARIVVCGYMLRHPVVGLQLAYFHWVLGLHRLGHEVFYLEESGDWPDPCYDPVADAYGEDPAPGLRAAHALLERHAAALPVAYVKRASGEAIGASRSQIEAALAAADLLVNLGGVCWLPDFELCPRRALLDMDPLFTQLGKFGGGLLDRHQLHWSYGANLGRPGCAIPTRGVAWRATAPPVVSELWEGGAAAGPPGEAWTTVASWDAYGSVAFEGRRYGQKDEEFLRLADLPRRAPRPLELALSGGDAAVRARLLGSGWRLASPAELVGPDAYREYLAGSRGEFSVAKHAYVATRSGWFSDRSVCYLAAGRPVVLQDTGFSEWLPCGRGLLAWSDAREAVECLERVESGYAAHSRAARELARERLDYRVVLPPLVEAALGAGRPAAAAGGAR